MSDKWVKILFHYFLSSVKTFFFFKKEKKETWMHSKSLTPFVAVKTTVVQ